MAPWARMSGSVRDAENRLRVANGMAAFSVEDQPVNNEAAWNIGSGA